jgi:hypothetical protein
MGTPQPAATIIDYTNRVDELRAGPWGSVIELEGQEGLHAELTDDEIVRECIACFVDLPFVDRARVDVPALLARSGEHRWEFHRNTAPHMRYLLMEPGHWRRRADAGISSYRNLSFAGDWTTGTQPTASMEAAVRSGRASADALRERAGLAPAGA